MDNNRENSNWEVVDEIPGERKQKQPVPRRKPKLPMKTIFWAGLGIGCVAAILARPLWGFFGNLLRNLLAYWWLVLIYGVYWVWMKRKQSRR